MTTRDHYHRLRPYEFVTEEVSRYALEGMHAGDTALVASTADEIEAKGLT